MKCKCYLMLYNPHCKGGFQLISMTVSLAQHDRRDLYIWRWQCTVLSRASARGCSQHKCQILRVGGYTEKELKWFNYLRARAHPGCEVSCQGVFQIRRMRSLYVRSSCGKLNRKKGASDKNPQPGRAEKKFYWPGWICSYIWRRLVVVKLRAVISISIDAGRSKLLSGSANCDLCKSPISMLRNKAIGELYRVIPFSSCAFNVCRSYAHFHFFSHTNFHCINENVNALRLYCTNL